MPSCAASIRVVLSSSSMEKDVRTKPSTPPGDVAACAIEDWQVDDHSPARRFVARDAQLHDRRCRTMCLRRGVHGHSVRCERGWINADASEPVARLSVENRPVFAASGCGLNLAVRGALPDDVLDAELLAGARFEACSLRSGHAGQPLECVHMRVASKETLRVTIELLRAHVFAAVEQRAHAVQDFDVRIKGSLQTISALFSPR